MNQVHLERKEKEGPIVLLVYGNAVVTGHRLRQELADVVSHGEQYRWVHANGMTTRGRYQTKPHSRQQVPSMFTTRSYEAQDERLSDITRITSLYYEYAL